MTPDPTALPRPARRQGRGKGDFAASRPHQNCTGGRTSPQPAGNDAASSSAPLSPLVQAEENWWREDAALNYQVWIEHMRGLREKGGA